MKIPDPLRKRRAISGIIGAVILFTLLFTVGTEYFIFVNNANNLETQSYINRGNTLAARLQESILVTTALSKANTIEFFLNNTGGATINITSIMLYSPTGTILTCQGLGLPAGQGCTANTNLPLVANVGKGAPSSGYVDTGYAYTTGTLTLDLISSNGNVFSNTYPSAAVSLAAQALSSGAIGDLYISFSSYTYYSVITGGTCPTGGSYSGSCLSSLGNAFTIPTSYTKVPIGFSVQVTDLNHQEANIVLDPYTLLSLVPESGKGSLSYINFFAVSISGSNNAILSSYTDVVLTYDKAVTVYFASANAVTGSNFATQTIGQEASGVTAPVFMVSHGCEGSGITTCALGSGNYGQNSPYVTTLFY